MEKESGLSFEYHPHPLFLKKSIVREEEKVDCYVCGKVITNLDMTYVCLECDSNSSDRFILHKKCGELRLVLFRQGHWFFLRDHYHSSRDDHKCDYCRGSLDKVVSYECQCCDLRFHTTCVDAFAKLKKELQHPSHQHHPVTLIRKPAFRFKCDGCGAQEVDMAYICATCDFMVHKTCALLPPRLSTDHHHHQLSLAFSFPEKHLMFDYPCDVCLDQNFYKQWVYYCGDCRFFAHINCARSMVKQRYNSIGDVIEFPLDANEVYNKLITPFVMREKGVDNIPIPSDSFIFKYHDHPLSLVLKDDESESGSESETKICDARVTPISSPPYYQCTSYPCTYFIHPICCFLPNTFHPNYQQYGHCHNYTLYALPKSKARDAISYWRCDNCRVITNGMGYKCEECGKKIDIQCASLPTSIIHSMNPYPKPLLLTEGYYHSIDNDWRFQVWGFKALLPKSITDREWDKHALLLTSNASLDHPSDFYCEFCEREMYPKQWMYHCRECDASFHPGCLMSASGCFRNVKLGGRFEMRGIHPNHSLTFTYITLKSRCDVCHQKNVYTFLGFECASCYFVACEGCGGKELEKIRVC